MNFKTLLASAGSDEGTFWFPPSSSTVSNEVDSLYYFLLSLSAFFFVLVIGLMIVFAIRFRRRPGYEQTPSTDHNTTLEIVWSVIPSLLTIWIFYRGFTAYMDMKTAPVETYEIKVLAKKWVWAFQYPSGYIDENLHVPIGRPVNLTMSSDDVIHSLFIPAFRVKMDVVPGRYTTLWFEATQAGEFPLVCAEYCGTKHSDMAAKTIVHPSGEFEPWLVKASDYLNTLPPVEAGEKLYLRRGCAQCHTVDGTARIGPSFKGTYGTSQKLTDGSSVDVDDNYIRESILEPMKKIRAGYKPVMPSFKGQLKDPEIGAIIEYIKSLK